MAVSRPGRRERELAARRVLAMPAAFAAALAAFALLPAARENDTLRASILGASGLLLAAIAALWAVSRKRRLAIEVSLRPQHYVQACAHTSIFLYWGWYWPPVYAMAPLIAAQLVFAYAFDMLLQWSRRDEYQLGFGPFPIIFSTNLFLWFRHDWFYLQFLMIAVGFAAKDLIRWRKEGRLTHVFNPSSFSLSVFSIVLILTGHTSWTWGPDIAITQFNPPQMYLFLFLIALPGQFFFGVTTMTMSAVLTTYLLGLAWFGVTGTYYFIDTYIPIAVFLGMHLLFTDPSTAPRTELGRIMFGMIYGASVFALYDILGRLGVPTFYDKLLPVPLMNLCIKGIDSLARSPRLQWIDPARLGVSLAPRRRNLAYISIWATAFVLLSAADGVGDSHPGHRVPFWQNACREGKTNGCESFELITRTYCDDGSGWACNELGILRAAKEPAGEATKAAFEQACGRGFVQGCQNLTAAATGTGYRHGAARLVDYPVVLRSGKGALPPMTPIETYTLACDQGWMEGCQDLGAAYMVAEGTSRDPGRAVALFDKACRAGLASSCSNLGLMYYKADGVPGDKARGLALLKQSCDMGFSNGCRWLAEANDKGL
jgi:hypothetical protein